MKKVELGLSPLLQTRIEGIGGEEICSARVCELQASPFLEVLFREAHAVTP